MKLLMLTQALDTDDPVLSAYTLLVQEIAAHVEHLDVICLKEGVHGPLENVRVHSLGKEEGVGKLTYIWRFYSYTWSLRHEYDAVFVHMNEEYVLLGGLLWKLLGKPIYMWRNHYAGSWRTRLAVMLSTKIFCTSKHSYTAKFKKNVIMPVGIDLGRFVGGTEEQRISRSILFLARISPSKRPEMLIDALGKVLAHGVSFVASIYGSPRPEDESYYQSLKARAESVGLHDRIVFHAGIPNSATPDIYRAHDIFVNTSPSGMFDKTLFEAAACGCRVIAASEDFHDAAGEEAYAPDTETLAERLIEALGQEDDAVLRARIKMQALARGESLGTLGDRLSVAFLDEMPL